MTMSCGKCCGYMGNPTPLMHLPHAYNHTENLVYIAGNISDLLWVLDFTID